MQIDKKKLSIQVLAFIGLALSIELAIIYYNANYNKYYLSSFCSINDFIDCDGAARTILSQFWGIPLAYWGIFFYVTILFLTFADKLKNVKFLNFVKVFKNPYSYISTLGLIAFTCSMILACKSIFEIQKICILCFVTYFVDLIITLVASNCNIKNILAGIKTTVLDFIDGAKNYPKTCVILILATVTFLTYSGTTYCFIPHVKRTMEIRKYKNIKYNPYRVQGNILGNPNADVVIELYSDYVCPLCYVQNIMLHKAVKEYKNVRINHHNYPFDKECNPFISTNMHPNACFMAKAALAAKKQNNYWGMSSLLYENKPKTEADVIKLVEKLQINKDEFMKDFESREISSELNREILNSESLDINATPTMFVNGDKVVGVKPYKDLEKILIEHGAKKK